MKYDKVLFVCRDNTSLSLMAESIFVHIYEGRQIYVASRGLVVLMPMPCNPKTELTLSKHGVALVSKQSTPLREEEFTDATLVLTFSDVDKERFRNRYPYVEAATLTEFVGETMALLNPYGGTLADYELCYEEMEVMLKRAAEILAAQKDSADSLDNMFEF